MFLSHIKTRHGYDFLSYFPHEFLMSFLSSFQDLRERNEDCNEENDELNDFDDQVNFILANTNEKTLRANGHKLRDFVAACRYGGIRCRYESANFLK